MFVFSLAINLLMLVAPLYTLQIFDRVLTSRSVETLFYLTIAAAFAFLVLWGLDALRSRIMVTLGSWLERKAGGDVLAASISVALARRSASAQALRDLGQVRSFLTGPAVFPILDAPWTPVFLVVVFLLHPLLGWLGFAGALLLLVLAFTNDIVNRAATKRAGVVGAQAHEVAEAAMRNADAVHAMGMVPSIVARWNRDTDDHLSAQVKVGHRSGFVTATSKFIRQFLQIGITGAGAWLVLQNELTAGGMIAGSILMARALAPIEQTINLWRSATAARAAYRRVVQLLVFSPPVSPAAPLPALEGRLQVDGVTFGHSGAKTPLLKNVSFSLKAGESLALIGPTAAGKTTLARILVGNVVPQLGHARLDGSDVTSWSPADRLLYIGYLPQDVELLGGTIMDNIARFTSGTAESVYEAAKLAGVHDDILHLPDAYQTQIGIGGMALSGGQRQRIALARAVYGNPKLIVLDEPSSNLDQTGEAALLRALEQIRKKGATVVIIAHRPNVLQSVDKVLVLRNGTVDAMGPRDEIFAKVTGAAPQRLSGKSRSERRTARTRK